MWTTNSTANMLSWSRSKTRYEYSRSNTAKDKLSTAKLIDKESVLLQWYENTSTGNTWWWELRKRVVLTTSCYSLLTLERWHESKVFACPLSLIARQNQNPQSMSKTSRAASANTSRPAIMISVTYKRMHGAPTFSLTLRRCISTRPPYQWRLMMLCVTLCDTNSWLSECSASWQQVLVNTCQEICFKSRQATSRMLLTELPLKKRTLEKISASARTGFSRLHSFSISMANCSNLLQAKKTSTIDSAKLENPSKPILCILQQQNAVIREHRSLKHLKSQSQKRETHQNAKCSVELSLVLRRA